MTPALPATSMESEGCEISTEMYFIYWSKAGAETDPGDHYLLGGDDIYCDYIECDLKMEVMEACFENFPTAEGWYRHGALDLSPLAWEVMKPKRVLSLDEEEE